MARGVHFMVPDPFFKQLKAEAAERRVTMTTILWERLGLFQGEEPQFVEGPDGRLTPVSPDTVIHLDPEDPAPRAHAHKFVRSSVTGLRKCACGKVER